MAVQTPWTTLLLQDKPGLHEFNHVLANVELYYLDLQQAMKSEPIRDQLLLKPNQMHSHILRSFEILRSKSLPGNVTEKIFEAMVEPLISDKTFSQEQVTQLVGAGLALLTKNPTHYLQKIANVLLETEGLFEHLVANEDYTQMLKTWILSKKNPPSESLFKKLGDRLIDMCNRCPADHKTESILELWEIAFSLKDSLNILIEQLDNDTLGKARSGNIPSLESMRALTLDDKKTSTHKAPKQELNLPDQVVQDLKSLGIPMPASVGGLTHAMEYLQKETIPSLARSALESFPCRVCIDSLTLKNMTDNLCKEQEPSAHCLSEQINAQDIFGKRVGIWKVLLSDVAFKNVQQLVRLGQFSLMENKLRDLASGDWKGKNLSHLVGSEKQKKQMKVPILEAAVSPTTSILWQIDVGFYDEAPWIQQQIVKVWQIVNPKEELNAALDQILVIQESYPPAIAQLCLNKPMQQQDGIRIPRRYENVKDTGYSKMEPIAKSKASQALIEMSTKFYNLTEPFLKALGDEDDTDEFPFDLSPEELDIIKHFDTSSLILGRSGTGKTTCLLFKMLAKYRARRLALQSVSEDPHVRQLLLTRSAYLASKLRAYSRSLIGSQSKPEIEDDVDDLDLDPTSFFALQSWQFPVVCTYDEFLDLLESTIRMAGRKDFLKDAPKESSKHSRTISQTENKKRIVDFSIFKVEYWSCLSGLAPPSCSPELLFAEIMGVIKGSSTTAKTLVPLSKAEYVKRNSKTSPAFSSEAEREKVYAAFERYEKQKKQRKEIDELDRVSDLLRSLKDNNTLAEQIKRCFEEIYVDEIQDLRCLDVILLFSCLSNARGIHLAGDTAQCISKDSVFRFPEIKALFYEHYKNMAKELNQPSIAKPVQFSLAKNYRSHQGILSFASWLMKLLWHGFPETIDKLEPEVGQIGGPQPIIFAGFDSSILSAKMIGLVKLNDNIADFGAEQVILVRDDASKDRLQMQIGEIALVLTILESKGMEFDDVLVYDFFSGSGLGSSYRCLSMLVKPEQSQFDSQKHAALCSELKSLYVAATRARKQLWFMETQENSIDPVIQALSQGGSLELAELVKQNDPDVAKKVAVLRAGGSVDPDRWLKKAAHFLGRKSYAEALFCYKKGNDTRGMSHAQACLHEQTGRSHRAAGRTNEFVSCFNKAIVLFLELGLSSDASDCYECLGQLDKAAEIWKARGQFEKAANLYEKGRFFVQASDCYHSCRRYEDAIEVLRRGDRFDEVVTYANRHKELLGEATLSRYSRLCNILLKQGRVSADLRALTINMLGTDMKKIEFFKEFEMWDQLRALYSSKGRWFEYYAQSVAVGEISEAMETLLSRNLTSVVDKSTAENLFHYTMAEMFFAKMGLTSNRPGWGTLLETTAQLPWLNNLMEQWKVMFIVVDSFQDPDVSASVDGLKAEIMDGAGIEQQVDIQGAIKDFFCLFMILFESFDSNWQTSIFAKSRFELLPMEILARVGSIIQRLDSQNPPAHYLASLLLTCGIFVHSHEEGQAIVLPWSPLIAYSDSPIERLPFDKLRDLAATFIQETFTKAFNRFAESAWNAFSEEFPHTCAFFLARGYCKKLQSGECSRPHDIPTEERAISKINCLLRISELFSGLSSLYYSRILSASFSENFLRRRRTWLSELQGEMILVTSLEQSPRAVAILLSKLQCNEFPATAQYLEELIMFRIGKEWATIASGGFSSFLALVQLIHALGPGPVARCERELQHKLRMMMPTLDRERDWATTPHAGLNASGRIRYAVQQRNVPDFFNRVREYFEYLRLAPKTGFTSLHAVLSVIEYAATYALCVANPDHGVVLPWSWAMLHVPRVLHPDLKDPKFTPREMRIHMSALTLINSYFCVMLAEINIELAQETLAFRGDCHALPWKFERDMAIILKRRCTEILMTMVLNLNHWPQPPSEYRAMKIEAAKALRLNMRTSIPLDFSNDERFRQSCIRTFEPYNGKDQMKGILLKDQASAPAFLRPFVQDGVEFTTLGHVLTLAKVNASSSMTMEQNSQMDASDRISKVTKIQKWWRVAIKALSINREKANTREGRRTAQLVELCNSIFTTFPAVRWSNSAKNFTRAVVFTDVLALLLKVERVSTRLRELRTEWKWEFELKHTATGVEELTMIHDKVVAMEKFIGEIKLSWDHDEIRRHILDTVAVTLRSMARKALRDVTAVDLDIGVLSGQIESLSKSGL